MTGHIGTKTPKFVPPRRGRPRFDPTQTGLCKFGWVWSSLMSAVFWLPPYRLSLPVLNLLSVVILVREGPLGRAKSRTWTSKWTPESLWYPLVFSLGQGRKGTQTQTFCSRYFPVGWGSSTRRGGGQKVRYVPRNTGKSNFLGGISQDFAGISRRCPKSLRNKSLCSIPFPIWEQFCLSDQSALIDASLWRKPF